MNEQPEQALVGPADKALLRVLKLYQELISPAFGPRCRYLPTCSAYAKMAIERFGAWKGAILAGRRLLRCQPFGSSGFDPVPASKFGAEPC